MVGFFISEPFYRKRIESEGTLLNRWLEFETVKIKLEEGQQFQLLPGTQIAVFQLCLLSIPKIVHSRIDDLRNLPLATGCPQLQPLLFIGNV
jgi:hypothetical protein